MTLAACNKVGQRIQWLTSWGGAIEASRGEPRKTTPKARVMLSAETAPTKASTAPAAASATWAQGEGAGPWAVPPNRPV